MASTGGATSGSFNYTASVPGVYAFETVATDLAGNVEALPPTPDAVTTVAGAGAPPPARPQSAAAPVTIARVIAGLPSTKTCVSRRAFTIHVVVPAGVHILSATILVNGRQVAVRKGAHLSAPVNLRGLPKGRYAVRIVVRLAGGKVVAETRRYRTCTPGHHHHSH